MYTLYLFGIYIFLIDSSIYIYENDYLKIRVIIIFNIS